ncbi:acylphosphatase [Luteimonas sp. WGS1318]|uniref:acylphosphatase n=1 Tax=Luteimonas sp. WGS1318 TaxID=3366815 RepID=UPI00372D1746
MATARFHVDGRVQGVGFRAATQARATALGVRGEVRNLDDGRVEVVATGAADALDALAGWLAHGPALARVTHVERNEVVDDVAGAGVSGFLIR